jgi:hypothetical protein
MQKDSFDLRIEYNKIQPGKSGSAVYRCPQT